MEALRGLGGSAPIVDISRSIWEHHEHDLRDSGDLFYLWQYDIRWAAHSLRKRGALRPVAVTPKGYWELSG